MEESIKRKKRYYINLLFLVCFIVGIVIMLQIKISKNKTVLFNGEIIRELKYQLDIEKKDLEVILNYKKRKEEELKYLEDIKTEKDLQELLKKQFLDTLIMAQNKIFVGEGIEIEVSDSEVEIASGDNPNDFIVHDQDMLRIVNDLKTSGAEVISINNQVLRSTTEIKCSGATITVNGKTFAQPFIIKAIGDKEALEASIKSKDSYAYVISSVYGIRISTLKKDKIVIDTTINNKNFRYIEEVKK